MPLAQSVTIANSVVAHAFRPLGRSLIIALNYCSVASFEYAGWTCVCVSVINTSSDRAVFLVPWISSSCSKGSGFVSNPPSKTGLAGLSVRVCGPTGAAAERLRWKDNPMERAREENCPL